MMEHLLRLLEESGADAGPEELADILWLAERVGGTGRGPSVPGDDGPAEGGVPVPPPGGEPVFQDADAPGPGDELYGPASAEGAAPGDGPARRGEPVLVRRATALDDPLGLMRALRPFGRRTAEGGRTELDEELSVRSSIEQRMVLPVLKPVRGRWLELAVVVDTHHSMLLWHDLVTELCRTITQTGIFRDVRIWYLSDTEADGTPTVTSPTGGDPRRPREISDPSGRRLVLVLTDTVADGWSGPGVEAMLRQWAAHGPTAVLNVLPRRLWSRGAGHPSGLLVRAARPAAPNATWRLSRSRARTRGSLTGRIAVPVVEVSPAGFAALADLVAGGGRWNRMSCLLIDRAAREGVPEPVAGPAPGFDEPGPDQAVRRFQADASPVAQELAGYLSAVPLTLPIMTLVRRVMLRESEHGHLAEVALGGLFEPWRGGHREIDTDRFRFEFRPGVREALLGSQLRHEITTVQEVVRREIAAYVDRPPTGGGEFPATRVVAESGSPGADGGSGSGGQLVEEGEIPFAVRPAAVREDEGIGRPLEEVTDPLEFGVHPAIEVEGVEGLPVLPAFVEREHDRELAGLMARAAAGESLFLLLVGNSASGTSRSVWEAVRRLPPRWRLWQPRNPTEVRAGLARVRPRTVMWLDHHWPYDGLADELRALVRDRTRGPVVVLGANWQWAANKRRSAVRQIDIPDRFAAHEIAVLRTKEKADPRLALALAEEPSGFVPRALSGVTWLVQRYLNAPAGARAVIKAIMSERGSSRPVTISADRLRERATLLFDVSKEEPADWFERALVYTTAPGPGTPGLIRVEGTHDRPHYVMPALAFDALRPYRDGSQPDPWPTTEPHLVRISTEESTSTGVVVGGRRILTTAHQLLDPSGSMRESVMVTPWPTGFQSRAAVAWFNEARDLALLHVTSPTSLSRSEEPPVLAEQLPEPGDRVQIIGFPLTLSADPDQSDPKQFVGRFSGMSPHAPSDMMLEVLGSSSPPRSSLPIRMSGSVVLDASGAIAGLVTSRGGPGQLWATPVVGFDQTNPDGAADTRHPLLPDPARSRAVLIGVASYEDPGLSDLPEVRANLAGLTHVLAPGEGQGSFDPRHVTHVRDPRTPGDVLEAIERAAAEAEDVLLVYYSGHSTRDNEGLGLCVSSTDPMLWRSTAISFEQIHRAAQQSRARRCVFILDCSYAGLALQDMVAERRSGSSLQTNWFLTASGSTASALAARSGQSHTAFTETLINSLSTTADGVEVLRVDELFEQLRDTAERRHNPPPELHTSGAQRRDLALAVPAQTPPSGAG
ncbi:caspase family protein [Streptomyces sp. GMY02]|uniref:caspase, EACC1-associated type n=1 Tax=Streptomyces sp. GMY02 TaxID=1333528 RepID=UPI001C2C70F0|nr:SAV_2336 N-terminal domain-related protein [Streptomyces sp. GMY02]QXE38607.1 caspase family protein [Streptomyces sp. GMY02]